MTPLLSESNISSNVRTAFRRGGWSNEELTKALVVYDGPADLLAHDEIWVFVKEKEKRRCGVRKGILLSHLYSLCLCQEYKEMRRYFLMYAL